MATPMRSSSHAAGHRAARVADPPSSAGNSAKTFGQQHFEYDDNEWDIGIGDLIIDLDADIEKTTEVVNMATNAGPGGGPQASKAQAAAKMHIEHSATSADKGLKMKIKRTKPGTKTSEAKHEIVKSNELTNGVADAKAGPAAPEAGKPASPPAAANNKARASGHRRDKTRDKHAPPSGGGADKAGAGPAPTVSEMRASAPGPPRSAGPGPAAGQGQGAGPAPGPPQSPAAATAQGSAAKPEQAKGVAAPPPAPPLAGAGGGTAGGAGDERGASPPPAKKIKTDGKEVADVCVGTSVGTITEPDCLGPCEPGTSVTLEGIVWHETEGGVLVVNVTWRGKTYVGTLLDCTRHDWAPPRFCDSPTSDLDARTPKGRETRSSAHGKLRNGAGGPAATGAGPGAGAAKGARKGAPASPAAPFPRPDAAGNKRKSRAGEEAAEKDASPAHTVKKSKTSGSTPAPSPAPPVGGSPPPSPVLLECPEPNCSKKYKHVNGLKYHQSHAHGSPDDDDAKDVASTSENDESMVDAPSPAKGRADSPPPAPATPVKKETTDLPLLLRTAAGLLDEPGTPGSTPPSPAPVADLPPVAATAPAAPPAIEPKPGGGVVKPGVLRFSTPVEDYPVGMFSGGGSKPQLPIPDPAPSEPPPATAPPAFCVVAPGGGQAAPPAAPRSPPPAAPKAAQFKVKPASALMPDEKKPPQLQQPPPLGVGTNSGPKPAVFNVASSTAKKKPRKSPASSPDPPLAEPPLYGGGGASEPPPGREEVRSPAYSDISDDGAPPAALDGDGMADKGKHADKKTEQGQALPHMPQYGMYHPFYSQQQYLVPAVPDNKPPKEPEKQPDKMAVEKEPKKEPHDYPQKVVQQHYYPYGYMPSYPYNMDSNYGGVPLVQDDPAKPKEDNRTKESPSPIEQNVKPIPNPIQVPTPGKAKDPSGHKDKHQNDNHQILKESIEMKNQMNSYMYSRPQQQQVQPMQQQQQQQQSHHAQREEDVRRFYVYSEQRRKEQHQHQHQQHQQHQQQQQDHKPPSASKAPLSQSPSLKPSSTSKMEIKLEEKKEKEAKQEGVKPTMETQGPPPPPTSQYAYIHPGYMQQAHYGALPFDPNHPMYRGIMVPGPYSGSPYLHAPMQRYHAPEDLSRAPPPPPPTKALDLLQHHAQYYSSHKIHELQERAIKSPTPNAANANGKPGAGPAAGAGPPAPAPAPPGAPPAQSNPPAGGAQQGGAPAPAPSAGKAVEGGGGSGKEARSPPPQRHVHTHHHTHVGLGYPMYPAPYGATVLASQQAAAVTVINPYPTK